MVYLAVDGAPAFDGTKTVSENVEAFREWLGTTKFDCSAPDDAACTLEPDVSIKFSFTAADLVWDVRAKFSGDKPGVYVVAALLGQELTLHRLQVGPVVPPPLPPDPSQPTTGPAFAIVLAANQELSTAQAGELIKLRAWSEANPSLINHLVLSPDHASSDARVKAYLSLVPASGQLPWCIITRARTDQAGAAVLHSAAFTTAAEVIAKVQGVVK